MIVVSKRSWRLSVGLHCSPYWFGVELDVHRSHWYRLLHNIRGMTAPLFMARHAAGMMAKSRQNAFYSKLGNLLPSVDMRFEHARGNTTTVRRSPVFLLRNMKMNDEPTDVCTRLQGRMLRIRKVGS